MDDLISRQAVLSLAKELKFGDYVTRQIDPYDVQMLPSAQPEKRTEERTETHACDLISRQAAIDALMSEPPEMNYGFYYAEKIKELPSTQPEIIRCKDCKFWKKYGYINGKPEFLPKCGFNQIYTSKDDFCSRAERKNNG